jgi:uncharacterized protein
MARFDRLYGKLNFPNLIIELLDCPGLLRLRDIRLANIPFFSFPSFASVSRYEHSLGVCHLANICGKKLELSDKDRIELMIACLYHDVGTPAFAHAIEEVFNLKYGFDHEEHLLDLILGRNRDIGKSRTQLYFGRSLKLERVCQSSEAKRIGIDTLQIAEIATGSKNNYLSDLVRSDSIDLDNIDNVIRAVSAMGVAKYSENLPIKLANSFIHYHLKFAYDETFHQYINEWIDLRKILYKSIYHNIRDLSLQSMIKEAVRILIEKENAISIEDWRITDEELIYNYLLKRKSTRNLTIRFKLGLAYNCLSKIIIKGHNVGKKLKHKDSEIKEMVYDFFFSIEEKLRVKLKNQRYSDKGEPILIITYFPDKSHREPGRPFLFFNTKINNEQTSDKTQTFYFFVFTSLSKEWPEKIKENFILKIRSVLPTLEIENFQLNEQYI